MFFSSKIEKRQQSIDIREAFNIWDILNSKYMAVERLQIWDNFAHDLDLKMTIVLMLKTLNENISILEDMIKDYSINSPDRNRSFSNIPVTTQLITDEFIALDVFLYLQEHIENLTKALRSSVTNESIRKQLKKITIKTIKETDIMVRYLTAKVWLSCPPMYKQIRC